MAARKKTVQRKKSARKLEMTPELTGFNIVPAIGLGSEEYLHNISQVKADLSYLKQLIAEEASKNSGFLSLSDLESLLGLVLTDKQIQELQIYAGNLQPLAKQLGAEEIELLRNMYPPQRAGLEQLLIDSLTGSFTTAWFELDEEDGVTFEYGVYGEGRCMECFRECLERQKKGKAGKTDNRRGWLKQKPITIARYNDYNQFKERIKGDLVLDVVLEENPHARRAYAPRAPRCKKHTPPVLVTLGHRITTADRGPKTIIEARVKSASYAYKMVELLLGKEDTGEERTMVDDFLAARFIAPAPDVWRKGVKLLQAWSIKQGGSFQNRIYVWGYRLDELTERIEKAIQGDRQLEPFYEDRIRPNMAVMPDRIPANPEDPQWIDVLLPSQRERRGGITNPIAIQIIDGEERSKVKSHLDYLIKKEQERNEKWSPLAWLTLRRIAPVFAPKFIQDYITEMCNVALERFSYGPIPITQQIRK